MGTEDEGRGGDEERAEGTEDLLSRVPLPVMPVTCTSRVCLPASRSGSYLHSADEVATVPRRLRVLAEDSRRRVYTGCLSWTELLSWTECAGEFLRATTITRMHSPEYILA